MKITKRLVHKMILYMTDSAVPTARVLLSDTGAEIFYFTSSLWGSALQMYLHLSHVIVSVCAVLL